MYAHPCACTCPQNGANFQRNDYMGRMTNFMYNLPEDMTVDLTKPTKGSCPALVVTAIEDYRRLLPISTTKDGKPLFNKACKTIQVGNAL